MAGAGRADLIECVLDLAAQVPRGRATTYGRIAVEARLLTGRGSARMVGRIMAERGGEVPWWRVVTASGAPAEAIADRALARLRAEGTPLVGDPPRVDLSRALFTGWQYETGHSVGDEAGGPGGTAHA